MCLFGECLSVSWRKDGREVQETALLFLFFQEMLWACIHLYPAGPRAAVLLPQPLWISSSLLSLKERKGKQITEEEVDLSYVPSCIVANEFWGYPWIAEVSCEENCCCKGLEIMISWGLVQVQKSPLLPLDIQKNLEVTKPRLGCWFLKLATLKQKLPLLLTEEALFCWSNRRLLRTVYFSFHIVMVVSVSSFKLTEQDLVWK